MADKRQGKIRKKLRKRFNDEIALKKQERIVILDQLALIDIELDGLDEVIEKIDAKLPPLINEINAAVEAVGAAYDARIDNNARSNLTWQESEPGETIERDDEEDTQIFEVINTPATKLPKSAVKYYKKQQDRDYGTSLLTGFVGFITAQHDVIAVVDPVPEISMLKVGDFIVDSIKSPIVFPVGFIPKIVGIGTTSVVRIVDQVQGSITVGSTIFASVGAGTTFNAPVGSHFVRNGYFSPETTVIGIGTTSISTYVVDPINGVSTAFTQTVPSFILSKPALVGIQTDVPLKIDVGVSSSFPSFTLDEVAGITSDRRFIAYRVDRDADNNAVNYTDNSIDAAFDFTKSPKDPLEIGLIDNASLGSADRIEYNTSGDPDPGSGNFATWESNKSQATAPPGTDFGDLEDEHPEPKVGGGSVTYYVGTNSWPQAVDNDGEGTITQGYATLGQTMNIGVGATDSMASQTAGFTATPPAPAPTPAEVAAMDATIASAESSLASIKAKNEPIIQKYVKKSTVMRKVRDDLQLQAWSLLQAAAFARAKIEEYLGDKKSLDDEDFEDFDPD